MDNSGPSVSERVPSRQPIRPSIHSDAGLTGEGSHFSRIGKPSSRPTRSASYRTVSGNYTDAEPSLAASRSGNASKMSNTSSGMSSGRSFPLHQRTGGYEKSSAGMNSGMGNYKSLSRYSQSMSHKSGTASGSNTANMSSEDTPGAYTGQSNNPYTTKPIDPRLGKSSTGPSGQDTSGMSSSPAEVPQRPVLMQLETNQSILKGTPTTDTPLTEQHSSRGGAPVLGDPTLEQIANNPIDYESPSELPGMMRDSGDDESTQLKEYQNTRPSSQSTFHSEAARDRHNTWIANYLDPNIEQNYMDSPTEGYAAKTYIRPAYIKPFVSTEEIPLGGDEYETVDVRKPRYFKRDSAIGIGQGDPETNAYESERAINDDGLALGRETSSGGRAYVPETLLTACAISRDEPQVCTQRTASKDPYLPTGNAHQLQSNDPQFARSEINMADELRHQPNSDQTSNSGHMSSNNIPVSSTNTTTGKYGADTMRGTSADKRFFGRENTHANAGEANTGVSGVNRQAHGQPYNNKQSISEANTQERTGASGPAPTTSGPHSYDILNIVDPRVDAYYSAMATGAQGRGYDQESAKKEHGISGYGYNDVSNPRANNAGRDARSDPTKMQGRNEEARNDYSGGQNSSSSADQDVLRAHDQDMLAKQANQDKRRRSSGFFGFLRRDQGSQDQSNVTKPPLTGHRNTGNTGPLYQDSQNGYYGNQNESHGSSLGTNAAGGAENTHPIAAANARGMSQGGIYSPLARQMHAASNVASGTGTSFSSTGPSSSSNYAAQPGHHTSMAGMASMHPAALTSYNPKTTDHPGVSSEPHQPMADTGNTYPSMDSSQNPDVASTGAWDRMDPSLNLSNIGPCPPDTDAGVKGIPSDSPQRRIENQRADATSSQSSKGPSSSSASREASDASIGKDKAKEGGGVAAIPNPNPDQPRRPGMVEEVERLEREGKIPSRPSQPSKPRAAAPSTAKQSTTPGGSTNQFATASGTKKAGFFGIGSNKGKTGGDLKKSKSRSKVHEERQLNRKLSGGRLGSIGGLGAGGMNFRQKVGIGRSKPIGAAV
jgi:hypothetical protein